MAARRAYPLFEGQQIAPTPGAARAGPELIPATPQAPPPTPGFVGFNPQELGRPIGTPPTPTPAWQSQPPPTRPAVGPPPVGPPPIGPPPIGPPPVGPPPVGGSAATGGEAAPAPAVRGPHDHLYDDFSGSAAPPGPFQPGPATSGAGGVGRAIPPVAFTGPSLHTGVDRAWLVECHKNSQSSKDFIRMTVGTFPENQEVRKQSNLLYGAMLQPLADSATPIPTVDFGQTPIIRCRKCRTYINPFVEFSDAGRTWKCNLCLDYNQCPDEYVCSLDSRGVRRDLDSHPELCHGTVEFAAPQEYMVRQPQPPVYIFVIDVSAASVDTGALAIFCQTLHNAISNNLLPGGVDRSQVCFITYDTTIHFYNLSGAQPQMLVVPELADLYQPIPEPLVTLGDAKNTVLTLLERLPNMFRNAPAGAALGSALQAAFNAAKHIGGKMLVFHAGVVSAGTAPLTRRPPTQKMNDTELAMLLQPQLEFYKEIAVEATRAYISIDMFIFGGSAHQEVATLSSLCKHSSGQLYYYPHFLLARDSERFKGDLQRNLTRNTGFEAVLRVRCSVGLQIINYYGNYYRRLQDLLALPTVDADKSFGIHMCHSPDNATGPVGTWAYVQCALLYTTASEERRIRVHNAAIPIVSTVESLHNSVDMDCMMTLLAKRAVATGLKTKLVDARKALEDLCVCVMRMRSQMNTQSLRQPQQPANSESGLYLFGLMPAYTNAVLKTPVFRPDGDISIDERAYNAMLLDLLGVTDAIAYFYPRLYSLNPAALPEIPPAGRYVELLKTLNLTHNTLVPEDAFLLQNGQTIYIWIGKNVAPTWLRDLFGPSVDSFDAVVPVSQLPVLETDLSRKVRTLISDIRSEFKSSHDVNICKQGSNSRFYLSLIDDATRNGLEWPNGGLSFADFFHYIQNLCR